MNIDPTTVGYIALVVALIAWIVYRQYTGRFVPPTRTMVVLPLVLVAVGFEQLSGAWATVTALGATLVAVELVLTGLLGAARAACTRLTVRDGYLYQRGGWPVVALWLGMIAARIGLELPFSGTSAGPALLASVTLSIGVSIGVQYLVLAARVRADGRPVRPGRGASAPVGATLDR